jgi:hypothetical protein
LPEPIAPADDFPLPVTPDRQPWIAIILPKLNLPLAAPLEAAACQVMLPDQLRGQAAPCQGYGRAHARSTFSRWVGGWRGDLATPFPSAPLRTGLDSFPSSGSPVAKTVRVESRYPSRARPPLSRMIASVVSASRMSRTSTPLRSGRLSPFAMCPAFPDSDYYGESVAIGLAPRRRSWASSTSHVRAWFRPSTHPYTRGAPRYLTARACRSRTWKVRRKGWRRHAVSSLRVSFMTGLRLARSGLDFKQFSLGRATRVSRNLGRADLAGIRFSGMLLSPVPFSRG